jgi:hypothetical protein
MTASWAYSVKGLGDRFGAARVMASRRAEKHGCLFWWKPEADGWHRFVFTNQSAASLFTTDLQDMVKDQNHIRRQWVAPDEIKNFADHCVHIRSVFEYTTRIFRDSTDAERTAMESVAPHFFEDLGQVLGDFAVTSACRVTEPWIDSKGHKNLAVGLFTDALVRSETLHGKLTELQKRMEVHYARIEPARNKLTSHADLETIMANKRLGAATWPEWDQFWSDLGEFVSLVHEHVLGKPFEIRAAMVRGDAEILLKKIQS